MTILILLVSLILTALAAMHLLWALGYWFPIRDESRLVAAVVGLDGAERMPGPIPCALVTVGLLFIAAAVWWPDGLLRTIILSAAAAVFLGRGAMTFTRFWRKRTTREPFASNDRRFYGPLALLLGSAILAILITG